MPESPLDGHDVAACGDQAAGVEVPQVVQGHAGHAGPAARLPPLVADGVLPRLFLDHFWNTSRVAEDEQGLADFRIAFMSPAQPEVGYIHFVGVRPDHRKTGLAREFYDEFALHARQHGARELCAITAPGNDASIRFHERPGFAVSDVVAEHNGFGRGMVTFRLALHEPRGHW